MITFILPFIAFFILFGILLLVYFNIIDQYDVQFYKREKNLIDGFRNDERVKDERKRFKDFIDGDELEDTSIKNWTEDWIKKQEKFSEFKHTDFEEFVRAKVSASDIDYNSISRNLLLIGLGVTFAAISLAFNKFQYHDTGDFQEFFQNIFLPKIGTALTSTLAAVTWTIILSFLELRYDKIVNEFSDIYTRFLIEDVYPLHPTKDEGHQINLLTDIFQEVALAAKDASEQVQSITQVTNLAVTGFNHSIDQFVAATTETQNILRKVERQQNEINQQNSNQEEITVNLRNAIDGLKAIFKLNSDSLETTSGSLVQIQQSHETNFGHVIKALEGNSNIINKMNTDLNKSMNAVVSVVNQVNDNESEYKDRLNNIMQSFSTAIKEFSTMIGKFDNATATLDTQLARLDKTFDNTNSSFGVSIDALGKIIEGLQTALTEFSQNSNDYNNAFKKLSEEIPAKVAEKMEVLPQLLGGMNNQITKVLENLADVLINMEDSSAKSSNLLSDNLSKHDRSFTIMLESLRTSNDAVIGENSTKIEELINTQNQRFNEVAEILDKISEKIKSESPNIFGRIFGSKSED